ncbi:uncharacterized protein BBA_09076 [Beauveria bassiana ARSEF 2860]|uniref:Uncharacterized protein n=1 Tax=Beauveria bassiana (strain ARSEF 2860) TaxID=655819 RepID=J5J659_BEAB2|nr:uncharacterized protein BBA_09076 [Beauveria bassiana ARSEF 2860]EJP62028.1 hypothetical protein BBA_09076 [Beauveria bassiana ARSEF 2860]
MSQECASSRWLSPAALASAAPFCPYACLCPQDPGTTPPNSSDERLIGFSSLLNTDRHAVASSPTTKHQRADTGYSAGAGASEFQQCRPVCDHRRHYPGQSQKCLTMHYRHLCLPKLHRLSRAASAESPDHLTERDSVDTPLEWARGRSRPLDVSDILPKEVIFPFWLLASRKPTE